MFNYIIPNIIPQTHYVEAEILREQLDYLMNHVLQCPTWPAEDCEECNRFFAVKEHLLAIFEEPVRVMTAGRG